VLSLFGLMTIPLRMLMYVVNTFFNAKASLSRIEHFFSTIEKKEEVCINDPNLNIGDVMITDGCF